MRHALAPGGGDPAVQTSLDACLGSDGRPLEKIAQANARAVERLLQARPTIVGIGTASEVIPGMRKDLILHAGPPVEWERMSGPTRGAVMGGLVYEGLAEDPQAAAAFAPERPEGAESTKPEAPESEPSED